MSIRDPGYDPRQVHPRSGAHPAGARPPRGGRGAGVGPPRALIGGLVLVVIALLVAIGFGGGFLSGGSRSPDPGAAAAVGSGSPSPTGITAGETAGPDGSDDGSGASGSGDPGASPTDAASPGDEGQPPASGEPAPALTETAVAVVPVANFRSARTNLRNADVAAIASATSALKGLVLVKDDADAILAALHQTRDALGSRLVTVASAEKLAANLAANRTRVGFLRADAVGPSVRALAWGGKNLFGVDRVASLAKWPLKARLPGPAKPSYDPAGSWTLVAGGDILLDRGVSLAIRGSSRGADFPFDGGNVAITGRCKDCSPMGWDLPYTKRTGGAGAVRHLLKSADLAIANFENPAPDAFRWHGKGTVFSANPKHISGLAKAGIDWVSLANNHIGDAGRAGMLQTMKNLDKYDIAHGGLGKNSVDAHKATLKKAGGVTVGFLGYDMIAPSYHAGTRVAGSAGMTAKALKADIKAARKAGADVVVVFPHWGIEYRAAPSATQRAMGKAAIDAGADLVIGNHPHWAEAMQVYKGKPIWYALGNLVFDQTWSEYTMEGLTLELTFDGKKLVQVRMRPHLILGKAQANFMDPAASGKFVMDQVWKASKGMLAW